MRTKSLICNLLSFALLVGSAPFPGLASATVSEFERWERQAANVTITRDDWGIAHINGTTDADAVFGMIYAQAEDDFNRIETNYLNSMGRLAEAEGETAIWRDLRMKLFIDPVELKKNYEASPLWLKTLMNAWADGLNYYLAKHPAVSPRVITRFEPWMALSFTEGSIGGDIESINLSRLQQMYDNARPVVVANTDDEEEPEPRGSNGIAIAPKNTVNKRSLLLINPHTSFYFRSELQMTSREGLNAYGAVTWGQFFIYQGFNERLGWMHTSSAADAIDEYREKIVTRDGEFLYAADNGTRLIPVRTKSVTVPFKTRDGVMSARTFSVFYTERGPVIRKANEGGEWISISLMHEPVKALMQSYGRTKTKNLAEFKKVMDLKANSSNNTLYADADGNIAYFHVNYVPRRDDKYNWHVPVDGSDPGTAYRGIHDFGELPHLINPHSGWVYNTNNWPWSAAGPSSLKQIDFPRYMDNGTENARGVHAMRVLENRKDFTLEKLQAAAYGSYLPWFEKPIPALTKAWDSMPPADPIKQKTSGQIDLLRNWNFRWSVDSVATSLAIFWAEDAQRRWAEDASRTGLSTKEFLETRANPAQLLASLGAASDKLTADFGKWRTPWGEINRFQRISNEIVHPFDDSKPSIPVGFTSAAWGSLASFGARSFRGSKKWYGTSGNSFVAVIEFGKTVRARAVTAGGASGDPNSKHFNNQAERYASGNLREVYFYPAQLKGRTERTYNPGK